MGALSKAEKITGSFYTISLEIFAIFIVAFAHVWAFPDESHHLLSVGILLVLVVSTVISLKAYTRRTRRTHSELAMDALASQLTKEIMQVLETALVKGWTTKPETDLCTAERHPGITRVWVLTPNLASDLGCRKEIIRKNFEDRKKYRYIIPHEAEARKQFCVLWETCASTLQSQEHLLEAKCLHERYLPPVDVIMFEPEHQVYFYLNIPQAESCVIPVPWDPLGSDITRSLEALWEKLPTVEHVPSGKTHVVDRYGWLE